MVNQTQFPLAAVATNKSNTGLMILLAFFGAAVLAGIYFVKKYNQEKKTKDLNK